MLSSTELWEQLMQSCKKPCCRDAASPGEDQMWVRPRWQEDASFITSQKGLPSSSCPELLQVLKVGFSTQIECYALNVRE